MSVTNHKTKTLVVILNHNLPEFTDRLFTSLDGFRKEEYELIVMDNGSKPEFISRFTTHFLPKNIFWGGALNEAFRLVLENPLYDSLMFLNNDIEVTGEIFVRALRKELFSNNYILISPCISGSPRPWKQMQNWGTKGTRQVKWIDNQAPLFHRTLIEKIGKFDDNLFYGWGQEFICFDICEENRWKIGVCDHITILHYAKQTILQNRLIAEFETTVPAKGEYNMDWAEFEDKASESYNNYFNTSPIKHSTFDDLRHYGLNYSFIPPDLATNTCTILKKLKNIFNTNRYLGK
jgi:hypothetical protein